MGTSSYRAGAACFMSVALLVSAMFLLYTDYIPTEPWKSGSEDTMQFAMMGHSITEDTNGILGDSVKGTPGEKLQQRLQHLEIFIKRAKLHARGTKTSEELRKAVTLLNEIMGSFPKKREAIPWRKTEEPKSVCPEDYFEKGVGNHEWFRVRNCTHGKTVGEMVTVVIIIKDNDKQRLENRMNVFIKSIQDEYNNVKVILANNLNLTPPKRKDTNVKIVTQTKATDGEVWNMLVKNVKTPYVLIARNIEILNNDSQLDRLMREIETLQIPVASGAVRNPNGHWKMGCYQTVHRNFTLKYFEGYDESFHECVFCDFTVGPFLTTVKTLEKFPFASMQENMGLFEDWFLRLTKQRVETILCPDSMFYVSPRPENEKWPQFMKRWNLFEVFSPRGRTITSDCEGELLKSTPTKALSPCLMEANAKSTSTMMELCENKSLICELNAGTVFGAVKFEHVLPWDIDGDINVLTTNFTAYRAVLSSNKFHLSGYVKSCENRYYTATANHWVIDLCERYSLESALQIKAGIKPTKVLYNGHWLTTPRNPGLFVRKKYGREIYQHALHFRHTQTSPTAAYKPNRFLPCRTPNGHDCLDRYNGDGNLQLKILLP